MQVLRSSSHRVMPWKNGGGSTTEVAVAPDGSGIDDFDWRISMAVVAADGPFSAFPEVDRTLAVLDGDGVVLHGLGTESQRLQRSTAPFAFPADAAVSATLLGGPITDLNVMTRRGRFRNQVQRLDAATEIALAEAAVVFLLAEAPCRVSVDGAAAVDLGPRDALRLDDPAGRRLALTADGPVEAYLVEILPA